MNLAALARYGATVVVVTLTTLYGYYPQWHWMIPVLAVSAALGIHLVPNVLQTSPVNPPAPANPTPAVEPATADEWGEIK
jgi:hypothetical protein